jgi:hypothetical protein
MLLPNLPAPLPVEWLKRLGIHDILGVKVEEWDYMYTGIYCDEVCLFPFLSFVNNSPPGSNYGYLKGSNIQW